MSFLFITPISSLSLLIPLTACSVAPIVLWLGKDRYSTSPPKGSVLADAWRVFRIAARGHWSLNFVKMGREIMIEMDDEVVILFQRLKDHQLSRYS